MQEKYITFTFCIVIAILYSLNFNNKWINKNFEKFRDKKTTWYWFRVFKLEKTKENFIYFVRGLSLLVIVIMTFTIVLLLK
jgi:type IV secretory pathway component VirB8